MLSNYHEEFLARRARMSAPLGSMPKTTVVKNRIPNYRNLVPDELVRPPVKKPTFLMLLDAVCEEAGVTEEEIFSDTRAVRVFSSRHILFYLCRRLLETSYPAIGHRLNRDHTTVLYGVRRVTRLIETDPFFAQLVNRCLSRAYLKVGHAYWGA